ncbi:hypothetical protein L195_g035034 [Trifolium pratense]|uniref:Uncharacterized protein n=1 Tax=Trifolium pratense TaxID=57577 RepID=A0A2K3LKI0_TRIPR|nr:hypothetical protein L195_g035034 [Trifolium pratense]
MGSLGKFIGFIGIRCLWIGGVGVLAHKYGEVRGEINLGGRKASTWWKDIEIVIPALLGFLQSLGFKWELCIVGGGVLEGQNNALDRWLWRTANIESFSVKEAYLFLTSRVEEGAIEEEHADFIWIKIVPLKVSVFA